MNATRHASQQYLKNAVMTARPEQLQVMLLDGAVRFAVKGREAIAARDPEQIFVNLDRAQRICLQLGDGLNKATNPKLAEQMLALYDFCYRRLVDASLNRDVQAVDDAVRILKHQRETWAVIVEKLGREAHGGAAAGTAPAEGAPGAPATTTPPTAPAAKPPVTPQPPSRRVPINVREPDASTVSFEG
jgi:flagellar secretion chaperone FliS